MVSRVPPPVPPRDGDILVTVGVKDALYVNVLFTSCLPSRTFTSQVVSTPIALCGGVYLKTYYTDLTDKNKKNHKKKKL